MSATVPEIVREIMGATGFTQKNLGRKIGVAQATISKWMSEKQSPNKKQWDQVLKLIDKDQRLSHLIDLARPQLVSIPLLSWVSAGKLADSVSQVPYEDVPLLAFADLGSGDFFALKVRGDSMDRLSPDGSTIIVNRADRQLISDKPYVFSVRGEATYKLWQPDPPHLSPFSTSPAHKPIFLKDHKGLEIVGRVRRTVLDL